MHKAALLSSVVLWGLVYIPGKDLLNYMGPNMLSFLRCLTGLLFLLPFAAAKGVRLRSLLKKSYVFYGLMGCAAYYLVQNRGVALCSSGMAALLQSTVTVFGILMGWLVLKEKMGKWKLLGAAVSIVGVVLASCEAIAAGGETHLAGVALVCLSQFFWSVYTAFSKKWDAGTDTMVLTIAMFSFGVLFMAPFAAYETVVSGRQVVLCAKMIGELLFAGGISTGIAILLWNYGLKGTDSGIASIAINFIPVVGVAASALAGSQTGPMQYAGCAVILIGVALAAREEGLGMMKKASG